MFDNLFNRNKPKRIYFPGQRKEAILSKINSVINRLTQITEKNAKCCHIFKTSTSYKIITMYYRETGSYFSEAPVYILPLNSTIDDLCDKIFQSLNSSSKITEKDYFKKDGSIKNYLKLLKEKSLKQLYSTSNSCSVSLTNNRIEIIPYKKVQRWLEGIVEDKVEIEYLDNKKIEITQQIVKVLDISYH